VESNLVLYISVSKNSGKVLECVPVCTVANLLFCSLDLVMCFYVDGSSSADTATASKTSSLAATTSKTSAACCSSSEKKTKTIQDDPKATEVFKSLFNTHKTAKQQQKAHWVTYNPQYF